MVREGNPNVRKVVTVAAGPYKYAFFAAVLSIPHFCTSQLYWDEFACSKSQFLYLAIRYDSDRHELYLFLGRAPKQRGCIWC